MAGCGHGARETYRPWLRVQEFSSYGNATRVPSLMFRRCIHTMSYIERYLYIFFEYAGNRRPTDNFEPDVMRAVEGKLKIEGRLWDWRDQLPIQRAVTVALAEAKRIRHSRYPGTGVPMVMSIDAFAIFEGGSGIFLDGKTTAKMERKRVKDKLRLHAAYADYVGLPHYTFTEKSVPRQKLKNIDLIRSAMPKRGEIVEPGDLFSHHLQVIKHDIVQRRRISIAEFCKHYDQTHGFPIGTALRLAYCLVWNRHLRIDMEAEQISNLHLREIRRGRP